MQKTGFGIVIKVKNLTVCKAFYRDILDLGNPVLDSSFQVEFQKGNSFSLLLEKQVWDQPPSSSRISWLFYEGDLEMIRKKMHVYGYPDPDGILTADYDKGTVLCRFSDPEGNSFYVPVLNNNQKRRR